MGAQTHKSSIDADFNLLQRSYKIATATSLLIVSRSSGSVSVALSAGVDVWAKLGRLSITMA